MESYQETLHLSSVTKILEAVCDTLIPSIQAEDDPHGFFADSARAAGTVARVEQLIADIPDPKDRAKLALLLRALDSPFANLLFTGRFQSFTAMDPEAREAVLLGWAHSGLQLRRAGFQALKRLVNVCYYAFPRDGNGHPAWRAAGYPGPLPMPGTLPAPLRVETIDRDTTLDCDVVVVGSGAGGGVVAGLLAQAGKSVVVLEKGENPDPSRFTQVEGEMLGEYYLDHGLLMTQSGSMPILAGTGLGGGTIINYTTSFPLPERVRAEWDARSGLSLFSSPRFVESLARVSARLDVNTRYSTPGVRDQILERGCRAMGWHVDPIPRNVTNCLQGTECGYCGYGCRHGAKNSTAATYLTDAAGCGARFVVRCDVERVLKENGRATGAVGQVRTADGRTVTLTVRARVVVAACGSVKTPGLLARSGLTNPGIGRGLRLHPATALVGVFKERVEPWTGAIQTRYSDQFSDQGDGYGTKFETVPIHFAMPASAFGWEGPAAHKATLARLSHSSIVGLLLRDRDAGRVATGRDGIPRVHYDLSIHDVRHLRSGLRGAAEVLAAAGATEIFSIQQPPVRVTTGESGWLDRLCDAMDGRGYTKCRMSYISFHQMASCAMGSDPARSVIGETGETHELKSLYVADASAFVTSSGVNPMITIMAIADHVARGIVEAW